MLHQSTQHANRKGFLVLRQRGNVRRMLVLVIMAAAGLILSAVVFYGVSAMRMYWNASRLMDSGQDLANIAAGCGSDRNVADASKEFVVSARALRDELNEPKWTFIRNHTAYGNDIDAARAMLDSVGNLVDGPFSDMMELAGGLSGFSMNNRTVDLSALDKLPAIVADARADIARESSDLAQVGQPRLDVTRRLLNAGKTGLQSADGMLDEYDELINLIPQLLGEHGARTYLAAIYNPSELRSGGGMVGNIAAITADHGVVTIGDFTPTTDFQYATAPLDTDNEKEAEVFGEWIWRYPQTTTMNPDYQRAAVTLANQWKAQKGNEHKDVAGVMALDPLFLQSIIGATGQVTLDDGKVLDGTDTAKFFLHDIYDEHPDFADQNAYTNAASKTIMTHVFSSVSASTASDVLKAIRDSSADSHLKLWMSDRDEFDALVQTRVLDSNASGSLPGSIETPVAGAYFSEMQASKLSWYLNVDITVTKTCGQTFAEDTPQADDRQVGQLMSTRLSGISDEQLGDEYTVVMTLKNTLTEQQAKQLPKFVTGEEATGSMFLRTTLMAPTGGEITAIAYDNASYQTNGLVNDRQFIVLDPSDTGLAPGKSDTIVFTVRAAERAHDPLNVVTTPIIGERGEYTGTDGSVIDQCGTDVPDAAQDKALAEAGGDGGDASGASGGSGGSSDGSAGGSAGGSSGSSSGSSGSGDGQSQSSGQSQNGSDSKSEGDSGSDAASGNGSDSGGDSGNDSGSALDSLDRLRSQIQCPVDLKKLAS